MDGEALRSTPAPDSVGSEPVTASTAPSPEVAVATPQPTAAADLSPQLPPDEVFPDASAAAASGDEEGEGEVAGGGVVLADELRDRIVKQVEYYFSDENLPTDEFLLKFVKRNKEGFVPIGVIASFRRMKNLVQDLSIIEAALRTSSKLIVSSDGKKVRRLHPLPSSELKDVKKRTVIVENLPLGFSKESIERTFGTVGKIVNITICDPHSVERSATARKPEFVLSIKVHVLVEYEAVEAAEKAVASFNDEKNWRSGMRVGLLAKRTVIGSGKRNHSSKEEQETISKKNNDADLGEGGLDGDNVNSVGHHEMDEGQRANIKGGRRSRYRGQGKGHIQQNASGQGHGSLPASSGSEFLSKPIPGPRMPDGTRGFTMGRGKSLPQEKAGKTEE